MTSKPMEHGSDKTPFQVFMSLFWNESGDLYFGSFENALARFLSYADSEQKAEFLDELEQVGQNGMIDDISSKEGRKFWGALGRRALSKGEYMFALRAVADCRR